MWKGTVCSALCPKMQRITVHWKSCTTIPDSGRYHFPSPSLLDGTVVGELPVIHPPIRLGDRLQTPTSARKSARSVDPPPKLDIGEKLTESPARKKTKRETEASGNKVKQTKDTQDSWNVDDEEDDEDEDEDDDDDEDEEDDDDEDDDDMSCFNSPKTKSSIKTKKKKEDPRITASKVAKLREKSFYTSLNQDIVEGILVPNPIEDDDRWLYPHLFVDRPQEWEYKFELAKKRVLGSNHLSLMGEAAVAHITKMVSFWLAAMKMGSASKSTELQQLGLGLTSALVMQLAIPTGQANTLAVASQLKKQQTKKCYNFACVQKVADSRETKSDKKKKKQAEESSESSDSSEHSFRPPPTKRFRQPKQRKYQESNQQQYNRRNNRHNNQYNKSNKMSPGNRKFTNKRSKNGAR